MEIINRGKQKQFLSSALGFTDGKLKTHLHIVHVVNSGKDTRERDREIKIKRERLTFQSEILTFQSHPVRITITPPALTQCPLQVAGCKEPHPPPVMEQLVCVSSHSGSLINCFKFNK